MEHNMKLHREPFESIRCGDKTFELRLYDEKRRAIQPGDTIVFTSREDTLRVQVLALHTFRNFAELYEKLPLLQCGYTPENVASAHHRDMDFFYDPQEQSQYGVVGIEIQIL